MNGIVRNQVRRLVSCLVFTSISFAGAFGLVCAAERPNILLIVADDLGYADVGFNGGQVIPTPNVDRLAATGIRLTDFRACPMCSPTRAGTLTGRWPLRFGMMRSVVPPWSRYGLPASEQTLPELLATGGYEHRACIGKWHLGHSRKDHSPLAHGFNHFYGHYNGAIDYFTHVRDGEIDWHRNAETIREEGYSTDLLGAEAVRTISGLPQSKPWFVYLPFNAPHGPFQAKEDDLARYTQFKMPNRRAFAAMVDSMDQAIGKVLTAVESRPDADNTLILFFSDNGGIPNVGSSNAPWRGAKLGVYEGGTRVCAAIRWPAGGLTGGRRFDGRIGYIDVLPTCLAAAGVQPPSNLDGMNVLPVIRGEQPLPARLWFSYIDQSGEAHASVHDKQWKLVARGDFFADAPPVAPQWELYDLNRDPREMNDLAKSESDVISRLSRSLRDFGKLQSPGVGPYNEGQRGFVAPKDWQLPD